MKPHEALKTLACRQGSSWLVLLLLISSVLLPPPALATRQGRQSTRIAAAAAAVEQDSSSTLDAWPRRRVHSPFNSEASMQIAARQRLFDYAVTEALEILGVAVEKVKIPEYKTTLEIPVIGGIDVTINNVNITDLQVCTLQQAPALACTVAMHWGCALLLSLAAHSMFTQQVRHCLQIEATVKAVHPWLPLMRVGRCCFERMGSTSTRKPTSMYHLLCVHTWLPAVPCRCLVNWPRLR